MTLMLWDPTFDNCIFNYISSYSIDAQLFFFMNIASRGIDDVKIKQISKTCLLIRNLICNTALMLLVKFQENELC